MANHTVSIFADAENSEISVLNGGSSGSPILLQVGDTLTVQHTFGSNVSGSIPVQYWDATHWTSASTVYIARGSSAVKTVKTGATLNTTDTISATQTGYTTGLIYVKIVSSVDTTPNDFAGSLSGVTGAVPGQEYLLGNFGIGGINTSVTMSVSGTAAPESRIGTQGTKSASSKTVNNGTTVYIWGTAPSTYNSSSTASVTIGSMTRSVTLTTPADPATGTRIPFTPSSGTVSLDDVRSFFGPKTGSASMSNYYRGGSYVIGTTTGSPNNSGVPASGTIQLDDFYNSFTTMYFSTPPSNKSEFIVTTSSSGTANFNWNRTADWEVGFGPDMEDGVDYRITHTTTQYSGYAGSIATYSLSFGGVTRDLKVASNQSAHTFAYVANNANAISVTVTANASTEYFIIGKIDLQIRHKEQTSYTATETFYYYVTIYGP
jgi:hypothetical protein